MKDKRSTLIRIAALAALGFTATAAEITPATPRSVTFTKDIAPILQARCQECHRKGSMAPMSLVTYEETRPWAKAIRQRVITRQMPPWHIDKAVGVQKFKNDMSLTDDQIDTVVRWVDAGAPQGDLKDMPAPRQWPAENEWKAAKDLGQPDLVVKSEPYTMAAHHQDVWWRPVSDIPLTEPRWVRAVEMRPGTAAGRKITHHAVAYLAQGSAADADTDSFGPAGDPGLRGRAMLMEWAVGKGYDLYRPDSGKLLLPGAQISWDVHIHAVGEQIRDNVELGIWLYPKGQEPKHRTYLTGFQALRGFQSSTASQQRAGRNIDIPPNSIAQFDNYTVLKQAAMLENFQPHMHLRGKAMSVEAILPDGTVQPVSYVGNFNFNWMTNYIYADDAAPVFPKGTMIHVTATYDNTTANPNNPDPDQWVGFGDRTVDEMGHAWMNVTYISDEEYAAWAAKNKPR
ncbi:MAG TPA: hypothetical protein VG297_18000 [Bryobacteraceae bacterium]|jgi:hypothetical protein|nr:hypothetical protein [Bryobacteraceae bacterium]